MESNANSLARYIRERGIQAGDKVGLILGKSVELYIAMLGIIKYGAAYVPIDADYPRDRVKYILENSKVSLTVTSSSIAVLLAFMITLFYLIMNVTQLINFQVNALSVLKPGVTPNDLSLHNIYFRLYRKSKGVQIEHKSICNLVRASQKIYQIRPEDRVYQGSQLLLMLL